MTVAPAQAKLNLSLVVGPRREDGMHEIATVMQPIELADLVSVEPAGELEVSGFAEDTLVRGALEALRSARPGSGPWRAVIEKLIPVGAGLGGGSSDAATALRLANDLLDEPLPGDALAELAAGLGADVPFFLEPGPKLATGTGTELSPLDLPQDYAVLVLQPRGAKKASTAAVYESFDEHGGSAGFDERRQALLLALDRVERAEDLARLPGNDLASSPLSAELERAGAFRAGASGAGPALYGLFRERSAAERAAGALRSRGTVWVTAPAW